MNDILLTEDHKYFVNGREVPGVTTILKEMLNLDMGMTDQFYRDRGTEIHKACELWIKGERGFVMDSRICPFLDGFKKFLRETGFEVRYVEKKIHNPTYQYCGTLDLFGMMEVNHDKYALIDIKGGVKAKYYRLQTALYGQGLFAHEQYDIERMCLHLDGKGGYFLDPHDDLYDLPAALSLVNAYHARRKYT